MNICSITLEEFTSVIERQTLLILSKYSARLTLISFKTTNFNLFAVLNEIINSRFTSAAGGLSAAEKEPMDRKYPIHMMAGRAGRDGWYYAMDGTALLTWVTSLGSYKWMDTCLCLTCYLSR